MEPLVALPDQVVKNSVPVGQVAGEKIDQAFIGSCANGTLDDFAIAAHVMKGQQVAPGVRFIDHAGLAGGLPQRAHARATSRRSRMRARS